MLKSILHPSDFSESSHLAFCHALKIALITKASLTLIHVAEGEETDGSGFPGVRETLEQWGVLQPGSTREAVTGLGLVVKKVVTRHGDPVKSTLHYLEKHRADLLVLATHASRGVPRMLRRAVAEPLAREAHEMTLFLPDKTRGFISPEGGCIGLSQILIPIDHHPTPQKAVDACCDLAEAFALSPVTFTLLHVCASSDMPEVKVRESENWIWRKVVVDEADPVATIRRTAAEIEADLIVMTTAGHEGYVDALRGSTTERVLRESRRPVLAVPS